MASGSEMFFKARTQVQDISRQNVPARFSPDAILTPPDVRNTIREAHLICCECSSGRNFSYGT